ncbi:MAG: ComF family protein [Aureispira sp.]|nr:ComF family protein [Aureispira sp.]
MLQKLLDLVYPRLCLACTQRVPAKGSSICISCQGQINPTNYHLLDDNPVLERFWGRIQLQHATTYCTFTKEGLIQQLIHALKYRHQPQIGIELGKLYGHELKNAPLYQNIDYIIPVPLHPKKQHKRGYNQAAKFAEGLAETMGIKWSDDFFVRQENTTTQTKKSRMDRFENVKSAFRVVAPEKLINKHLLLVDDVITTGATLEACASNLIEVEGVKVSLAAIALAS